MQRKLLGWQKRTRDSCAPLVCYPFCSSIGSEENPSIQQRWAEGLWQFLGMVSMAVWIQIVGEPLFFLLNSLGSLFFLLFLPGLSPPHVNKEFIE